MLRAHAEEQVWTPAERRDREIGIVVDVTDIHDRKVAFPISINSQALAALDAFAAKNTLTRSEAVAWLADPSRD